MKHARNLIVLDLETTGLWIEKDKIVEIAMIRCEPGGVRETYVKRVNPGILIPPHVSQIIGIKNDDLREAPYFKEIAKEVFEFIGDSDFAGYNLERMDLPMLEREFREAGYTFEWKPKAIYDAQKVFHINEKRDLSTAYKFYCNKEMANAHSALYDAQATLEILCAQIKRYGDGNEALQALDCFHYKETSEYYGEERRFRWWNGELYPLFGRYAKQCSIKEIAQKDPEYLRWILGRDFSEEIKELAENALHGKFPEYPPRKL